MKVAYLSPLNPIASGISDFSEELLLAFNCSEIQLDIFVDGYEVANKDIQLKFKIYQIKDFESVRYQYDKVIYQIGNNERAHESIYEIALKHKGIVELHDVSLHHMIAAMTVARGDKEEYKNIMTYCHSKLGENAVNEFLGGNSLPPWETSSMEFSVNKLVIDAADSVIVHSDYAKQLVKGIAPEKLVHVIYLHTPDLFYDYKEEKTRARESLKLSNDEFIIGSFGFATKEKRIHQILQALAELKKQNINFKYFIVGKCSDDLMIDKYISEYQLSDYVVVTGFVSLEDLKKMMLATDVCFNLRYPTQGESSAILHRLMGMGKCVCVTDIGSFKEYEDTLIKINPHNEKEEIVNHIKRLYANREELENYEAKAYQFAAEKCNLQRNVEKYVQALNGKYDVILEDLIVDKLMDLGIDDSDLAKRMISTL